MSSNAIDPNKESSWGTELTYISGFLLSLTLTMVTYLLVRKHLSTHHIYPSDSFMLVALIVLAVSQLFVQLVFFLHLDRESKPRWNLTVAAFAVIVVLILVLGSLWIMYHLNYSMSPQQQNNYLLKQDGGL